MQIITRLLILKVYNNISIMNKSDSSYKYIYGPVSSWRLGNSLGVDLISKKEKTCTFDCAYCQIGKTEDFLDQRKIFVKTKDVLKEINLVEAGNIDYITFSGKGEPTLASNLGDVIEGIRKIRHEKIAIITNTSLIDRPDVQQDLKLADIVMIKIDACNEDLFLKINRPMKDMRLKNMIEGIKEFRSSYKGKIALQIMFVEDNKKYAQEFAKIAKDISPNEVDINTPLRPSPVKPLSKKGIDLILPYFKGQNAISVYDSYRKPITPLSTKDTLKRRGSL
ncbi:MAG: radical SAM protein [Candidatus Omnitrophota bacterium]